MDLGRVPVSRTPMRGGGGLGYHACTSSLTLPPAMASSIEPCLITRRTFSMAANSSAYA